MTDPGETRPEDADDDAREAREAERSKRRAGRMVVLVLLGLVVVGGGVALVSSVGSVKGSFSSEGASGTWTMQVDDCASGDRRSFYGVDLAKKGEPQRRISLVEDTVQGTEVRLEQRGRAPIVFRRDACPDLSSKLDTTGIGQGKANIRGMKGLMSIDCTVEGTHLRGRAEFTNCP